MKRILIGAIVGGLIIFIWQFLSFALINFHQPAMQYTPKQSEILGFLSTQLPEEGQYFMPTSPPDAPGEEMQATSKSNQGKPWALVSYHKNWESDMTMKMIRGFLSDIIMIALFCLIIARLNSKRFATILITSLLVGLISFLYVPYTNHIWYDTFDIWAHFLDAILGWGLVGLWLGWWYGREVRSS